MTRRAITPAELREALEDMVWQFAYRFDNPPRLGTGGLSALENAFDVLGWDDPYMAPEPHGCDEPGCGKWDTCGWPSPNGYRRTCFEHSKFNEK